MSIDSAFQTPSDVRGSGDRSGRKGRRTTMSSNHPHELEEIPGIGEKRAEALRGAGFRSISDLREASIDELIAVEMIDEILAEDIKATVVPHEKGEEHQPDQTGEEHQLTVRLDTAAVEEQRETDPQDLQVVARTTDDTLRTAPVTFEESGATAELTFTDQPGALGVFVGPEQVEPAELVRMQTLTENLPERRWVDTREVELEPIRIPEYYWDWWHRWCRTFTVRGRLTCPDGSPVPGAKVCASDVDSWFYWTGTQQVGCDTTDVDGTFEIEFRWCCGFWPWWWWETRTWDPNPDLIDRIEEVTTDVPELSLASGGHKPGLTMFDDLLADDPIPVDEPLPEIEPDQLERIRGDLIDRLPRAPDLRQLGVWPWSPWEPWSDCRPDLIFEATQDGTVILEEDIGDARWDVSTTETVDLTANEDALCTDGCAEPPCPDRECLVVTEACNATIDTIGGNIGAQPTPEGYARALPSVGATERNADRPFAGSVALWRSGAPITDVDYLELEYDDGTGWTPATQAHLNDFSVKYYHVSPSGGISFPRATFNVRNEDGHWVVKTREHMEETKSPVWPYEKRVYGRRVGPINAYWVGGGQNRLLQIDSTAFDDGTYRFRLVGYENLGTDDDVELERRGVVRRCLDGDEESPIEVTLTFDNRTKVPVSSSSSSSSSSSHSHPTASLTPGSGTTTVHKPYVEPDTSITAVRIIRPDGTVIGVPEDPDDECPSVEKQSGTLQIDFLARDPVDSNNPTGHLSHYTLHATFGRSKSRNLLDKPTSSVTARGAGSPYTGHRSGDSSGTYGRALDQGATRPDWEGGQYRLEIDLEEAFPIACCYQLELRARKRTIANCHHGYPHRNISEYSIGYGI